MNKLYKALVILVVVAMAGALVSCASEAPETQKLFTDAKQMWDDLNKAFSLEKGQERIDMMRKILNEEWDVKIIAESGSLSQGGANGQIRSRGDGVVK